MRTSPHREEPCAAVAIPASLAADVEGYDWARDGVGESGGAVYRLHGKPGHPDLFLKQGEGTCATDVTDEMVRLMWLAAFLPVPAVRGFVRTPDAAWLLMTAIPGLTAWQALEAFPAERPAIVDALADFLRRFHAIPVSDCPFTSNHACRLAQARRRLDAGLVDVEDFDEERQGWNAEQVWDAMTALLPLAPDSVVTHGDFSLDNLLWHNGTITGCIDVGRAGVADRYQDLAILWNCLCDFEAALQKRLFHRYATAAPDWRKLNFHLMLDEFF
ncbi:APH(3')-I family aminoglycoside O-phosphotransferase [Pararhodospirillum oryzae]|uniref:Aminoglycoside 3'-phosphotransferase n=1 Tax=Pararhodospirillum oryzae TaxID=478448 RepID=A0A512HAF7_9PROT|nr:APH(3')-I family aminoglycoside O-phosphotransferase [Pararhodospirillum oryzae]GEO82425.1 aminoglycoside phosphotransferase APH(3') [Pararhodospirillum oryzae]